MASKIVLIEDNSDVRENIVEILELDGYKVHAAANGIEGVRLVREIRPDLILCDIMMPEMDGYGVLHMVNKDPATNLIPFIFLTAKAEKEDFRKGMNLGADDYITKPFEEEQLLSVIEMRLKKRSMLGEPVGKSSEEIDKLLSHTKADRALNKLNTDREERKLRASEVLFEEGNHPHNAYLLMKGKIKVFRLSESGKPLVHRLYGDGDFIGVTALLGGHPYRETAEALEETTLSVIPAEDFFTLVHNDKDVSARFIKMLAESLDETEEKLVQQAYDSVRKRVAGGLLELKRKYGEDSEIQFKIHVLREDLAALVGTSKETVIRTLSDFRQEELIEITKDGSLIIHNEKGLEQIIA